MDHKTENHSGITITTKFVEAKELSQYFPKMLNFKSINIPLLVLSPEVTVIENFGQKANKNQRFP